MKMILAMLVATAGVSPANAHDWDERPPYWEHGDWRLVGGSSEEIMLLGNGHTARVGSAVSFEILTVQRTPSEYGEDHVNEHYLIDCGLLKLYRTHVQGFTPSGKPGAPPLVRVDEDYTGEVPASSSLLARAARMACGLEQLKLTPMKDPYKQARGAFGVMQRSKR